MQTSQFGAASSIWLADQWQWRVTYGVIGLTIAAKWFVSSTDSEMHWPDGGRA